MGRGYGSFNTLSLLFTLGMGQFCLWGGGGGGGLVITAFEGANIFHGVGEVPSPAPPPPKKETF